MSDAYSIERKRDGGATSRLADWFNEAASPGFVAALVWGACVLSFALWHSDYRSFFELCNADDGAALHTDKILGEGALPGRDFFYHYGLLPLLVGRGVFALAGRTPLGLLFFLAALFAIFCAGLTRAVSALRPTHLGAILVAVAAFQTTEQKVPTHAMEAAILVWAVAFRVQGRSAPALALAALGIFVKVSMASVLLVELIGFVVLDAWRERRARPLAALIVVPVSLATGAVACGCTLGWAGVRQSLNPSSGAEVYRHFNLGFFKEGRHFWAPAGHTAGWYIGTIAGVWLAGSLVLAFLAVRSAPRIVAAVRRGRARDVTLVADETTLLAAVAHFAFVFVFFGPSSSSAYYYTWVLVVGLAPALGRARLEPSRAGVLPYAPTSLGWLGIGVALVLSLWAQTRALVTFVRRPLAQLGPVTAPIDEADEWKQAIAVAHSTGGGSIAVVALSACFELIDPTMREGRYWEIVAGARRMPALDETIRLAESSDAIFVTKSDYPGLLDIPEMRSLLEDTERIHDGRYFLVFRPRVTTTRAL